MLVKVIRGDFVESVHRGSIAVADTSGRPVAGCGNIFEHAFMRSAAKPFQVMAAVLLGAVDRFGLTEPELAVLCSSHSGEARHLDAVRSVLGKIGLDESALRCGVHPPMNPVVAANRWRHGLEPTVVCNNCSGSHAGMLAACVAANWSVDDYVHHLHPIQRYIRDILIALSGAEQGEVTEAVDNCAAPTFRLPLVRSATAFARLGAAAELPDDLAQAARTIVRAMTRYPEMVGGEHRFDSDVMAAIHGRVVSKGGAQGFQGVGQLDRGVGLALKISDGADLAAPTATVQALSELGMSDAAESPLVDGYRAPALTNLTGETVGHLLPAFHLVEYR